MEQNILYNIVIKKIHAILSIYTEANKVVKRKNRQNWAIILKYEGETMYTSQGKRYVSNLENMIILPKGSEYEWQCTKSGRFYTVEFDCDAMCESIFSFPVDNGEKILQQLKDIDKQKTLKKPTYKLECIQTVYSIILSLLQIKQPKYVPSVKQEKIAPSVDYILSHYDEKITNDMLASFAGLSTIYFRKLFTETFGVSPIAYVHKIRIKKAKEMLSTDYDSVSDIALSLGYANLYDFSRTFKKHTGMSPSAYVKSLKKAYSN